MLQASEMGPMGDENNVNPDMTTLSWADETAQDDLKKVNLWTLRSRSWQYFTMYIIQTVEQMLINKIIL